MNPALEVALVDIAGVYVLRICVKFHKVTTHVLDVEVLKGVGSSALRFVALDGTSTTLLTPSFATASVSVVLAAMIDYAKNAVKACGSEDVMEKDYRLTFRPDTSDRVWTDNERQAAFDEIEAVAKEVGMVIVRPTEEVKKLVMG